SGEAIARDTERHADEAKVGARFSCLLRAFSQGGQVKSAGDQIVVKGASSVLLLLSAATSLRYQDPGQESERRLKLAAKKSFDDIRSSQVADHRKFFRRVDLVLDTSSPDKSNLPTDERLKRVQNGEIDLQLEEQYFQFGRYLLMASSRPGSMAANLQGIWN